MTTVQQTAKQLRARAADYLELAKALDQLEGILERAGDVTKAMAKSKRHLSPAGRRRIVRAQRARWAKIRASNKAKKGGK